MGEISDLNWQFTVGPFRLTSRFYRPNRLGPPDATGASRLEWFWRERYSGAIAWGILALRRGDTLHWCSWGSGWRWTYDEQGNHTGWQRFWAWPRYYHGEM